MASSVLILDDDRDFNSLLTDIYEQADYIVTSMEDPVEAVNVVRQTDFDLILTDQKMPDMSGAEFMKEVKKIKPDIPVIMVSGYLENDTIRELISEGVGGVFLKPLNIFSLLERTAELIEEARKIKEAGGAEALEDAGGDGEPEALDFEFRSFPCKSEASVAFAERLHSLRSFRSTLSLIGESGTHFRSICEDLHGFFETRKEPFVYLSPATFDQEQALALLENASGENVERITCVFLDIESMSEEQKGLAAMLPKKDGPFENVGPEIRVIFCVGGDLDTLYDQGVVDENLYILMGTTEVRVPALRECPADIPVLAQQIAADVAREKGLGTVPRFDASAMNFFREQKWPNNYAGLRAAVRRVLRGNDGDELTLAEVKRSVHAAEAASPRAQLDALLGRLRIDAVKAVAAFFGGDSGQAAAFFGVEREALDELLRRANAKKKE